MVERHGIRANKLAGKTAKLGLLVEEEASTLLGWLL